MRVKSGILGLLVVFAVLFSSIALAYAEENGTRVKDAGFALNNTKCKTDLVVDVVDSIVNITQSSVLSSASADIQNNYNKLLENVLDREVFEEYLVDNYNPSYKAFILAFSGWKKINFKNLTNEQKKNLRESYKESKKNYDICYYDSLKQYGNSRIISYDAILDNYQKKADKISDAGVDISSLDKLITDARAEITIPLENALISAKNSKEINSAIKTYCLFDGCKNGTNFHLGAKFAIAKLKIALNIVKSNSSLATPKKISELEDYIDNASNTLTEVGNKQYTNEQKRNIWDNIKNANNLIKQIKNIIRSNSGNKK